MGSALRATGGPVTGSIEVANVEAEGALIGALMLDNRLVAEAVELVQAEDFADPFHGFVFQLIVATVAEGNNANPIALRPALHAEIEQRDRSFKYLVGLVTNAGTSFIGALGFARQIHELGRLRRLHTEGSAVLAEIASGELADASSAALRLEALAFEAAAGKSERSKSFSMADAVHAAVDRAVEIQEGGKAVGAFAPDLPELTDVLGPLERTHLTVLAGRPGMGKSALVVSAARSMAIAGFGVDLVSLEMGKIDLGTRMAADLALQYGKEIPHAKIRDGRLRMSEIDALRWCADQVKAAPLEFHDVSGCTIARLRSIWRRTKTKFEARGQTFDVGIVDYLQLLSPDRSNTNRVVEMTAVSNGLKQLAKELDIAVVALSQLSRDVEKREDKRPHLSDLRETGAIEQDADNVGFLYREYYYLKQAEPDKHEKPAKWEAWDMSMRATRDELDVIVAKRRGGATGSAKLTFLAENQAVRAKGFIAGALFDEE